MMEIEEEDILRNIANGGQIDYSVWPALLPRIISRIERVARHEFPIPNLPPPAATIIPSSIPPPQTQTDSESTENFLSPLPSSPLEPTSSNSSQDNKENTPIAPRVQPPPTSAPAPAQAASAPAAAAAAPPPPGTLPQQITSMLTEITSTLQTTFPKYPPHTLQRLSELVIAPKHHYRSLPTYLHALDRVVHVTSGLNIYPLPPAIPDMKSGSLLSNGLTDALAAPSPWATPGSDEALGGALLTPIPWLQPNHHGIGGPSSALNTPGQRSPNSAGGGGGGAGSGGGGQGNAGAGGSSSMGGAGGAMGGGNDLEGEVRTESTETIDGPNGVGSIETVSVSVNGIPSMGARGVGVTQGELLRQEQRAGVVPVSQLVPSHHVHSANPHAQVHRRASASPTSEAVPSGSAAGGGAQVQGGQAGQAQGQGAEADRKSVSPPTAAEVENAASSASSANVGNGNGNGNGSGAAGAGAGTTAISQPNPNPVDADAPVGSIAGSEEEKPHARGPEEIGPEDMGPQHGSSSSTSSTVGGPGGVEMQGIDIEAAVGRKRGASKSPPTTKPDEDKMDVEVSQAQGQGQGQGGETSARKSRSRSSTPKREAEDELDAGGVKRVKEGGGAVEGKGKAAAEDTAMDTSTDGKEAAEGQAEKGGG
ncbi:uncharacterized protein F4807DRAFT_285371 [Annulohypoxylon truncatum]|uniref:uncharacterized protein n=1 Tax=Annulohypoxylon truncatum TaxID=327061 RepID=UPI002008430E|nr:uncharacterized protein F4807DRAFT_285371 [Annulohypoxylon truncatum]KAI1205451.1 hypothetical protein F4807DRAFT_285371 [Annulohypoxylon truncatum]